MSLTGPGGLLSQITTTVLETALNAEMDEHLGYSKGAQPVRGDGNHRNGRSQKTVHTDVGSVRIDVPRDRNSEFEPRMVPKHARRIFGFDESIISLYANPLLMISAIGRLRARRFSLPDPLSESGTFLM